MESVVVVDGIGGRAKSVVRSSVMSKRSSAPVVQNARDFYKQVSKLMPSTKVILIENKDIPRPAADWGNAEAVPGIKKYHGMVAHSDEATKFYFNAYEPVTAVIDQPERGTMSDHDNSPKYKIGDWVLVRYDSHRYPGEVTAVAGSEVQVSTMEKADAGNN